jgi:oligoendopeptidase F
MSLPFHSLDAALAPSPASADLGELPEWRLEDLYEGMDSPRFAADLERAEREAKLFAEAWRGKLSEFADRPNAGEALAAAVKNYESMQDLTGRIMAYASLLYASDTSNPAIAKFYGDAQERVTALAGDVLFFELELNRLDDSKLNGAMATPARIAIRSSLALMWKCPSGVSSCVAPPPPGCSLEPVRPILEPSSEWPRNR